MRYINLPLKRAPATKPLCIDPTKTIIYYGGRVKQLKYLRLALQLDL